MHKIARKRRTREHVIADLAVNHVERIALRCGHTVERYWHDYGFDLALYTYNRNGEYENGDVRLQVKATDRLGRTAGGMISYRIQSAHLRHWLNEPMPVILIVYDAKKDEAFWVYIQNYFEGHGGLRIGDSRESVSVRISTRMVLNDDAIRKFAQYRDNIIAQSRGVIRHHE